MTTETKLDIGGKTHDPQLAILQETLQETIETLIHLGVQVHDFTATNESREGMANQINKLVHLLKAISTQPNTAKPIMIPLDIIQYIEDGRNPDIYSREFIEVIRKLNQFLNGKSRSFGLFQETLAQQIKKEFPELAPDVDQVLINTHVE